MRRLLRHVLRHLLRGSAVLVAVVAALVTAAYLAATRTDLGRERVRRIALGAIREAVHGDVRIGRIDGNILDRFSLHDVVITDSAGAPFVAVQRVDARLDAGALFGQRVRLHEVTLVTPVIWLEQGADERWNYERLFPGADTLPADTTSGFGSWIRIEALRLRRGTLTVVRPWSADVSPPARDSAIAAALAGQSRVRVTRSSAGLQQRMSFTAIDALLTEAVLADPTLPGLSLEVDSLAVMAAPFHPPVLQVMQLAGSIRTSPDSMTLSGMVLHLPESEASGRVAMGLESGDIIAALDVTRLAVGDVRALYPALPDSGTGRMLVRLVLRDSLPSEYDVRELSLQVGSMRLAGGIGLVLTDDVTRFAATDLTVERLSSTLVEQLVPGVALPVAGEVSGRARADGPLERLQLTIDAAVRPARHAAFTVYAAGVAGTTDGGTTSGLRLRATRVPLSLARALDAELPVGGVVSFDGTVDGTVTRGMTGRFAVRHVDRGQVSRATVRGRVSADDTLRFDVTTELQELALAILENFVDSTVVQGTATGTVHLAGTPRDVAAEAELQLPQDGRIVARGSYRRLAGDSASYQAEVTTTNVAPQAVVPSLPDMTLTGVTTVSGVGTDPATLRADISSRWSRVVVDSAVGRDIVLDARARDGLLQVDSLYVATDFASLQATGAFGLVDTREGTLRFAARIDDLAGLDRWIATGDTATVPARPAVGARVARLRAMADSIRAAERALLDPAAELAASMSPARQAAPAAPVVIPPVRSDSTGGTLALTGEARGHVKGATIEATLRSPGVAWNGNLLGATEVRGEWRDVFTAHDSLRVEGSLDAVRAAGFAFDRTEVRATYMRGVGEVAVTLYPGDSATYRLEADYALSTGEGEIHLRDLALEMDAADWRASYPATVSWRGPHLQVDSLELRDATRGGRIFVRGDVPETGAIALELAFEGVRIAPWIAITQGDLDADGVMGGRLTMAGTRKSPQLDGRATLTAARVEGALVPDASATFRYADREMQLTAETHDSTGRELLHVDGTLPVDLALAGEVVERLPSSAPIRLTVAGDSIPLSPAMAITDALAALRGSARGEVLVHGTWDAPRLTGDLDIAVEQVRLTSTGVMMRDGSAHLRLAGDAMHLDAFSARSKGTLTGSGVIGLASLARPTLDLTFRADELQVLDDATGKLSGSGTVQVSGPLDSLLVTGTVALTQGVIYLPDPEAQTVIDAEDPTIFALVDSTTAADLGVGGPTEAVRNMRLDLGVEVRRGTFGRSAEANVEVYGDLRLRKERGRDSYLVTGTLNTDQGHYTVFGKRFDVVRGTVRFLGDEELNPLLQVVTAYDVRQAGRAPLEIRVVIGGTLDNPTVNLESNAQPSLSESDLLAFLAFGRSSSSLLQFSGTGVESGGAGGASLVGNMAALATRQLASIGIGALVDQVRADLAAFTRADILNITPAPIAADVTLGALETVLRGTDIEIGRYLDDRTFLLGHVRPSLTVPGASVERRLSDRLTAQASLETRLQSSTPSLGSGQKPRALQVLGALLTWRIAW